MITLWKDSGCTKMGSDREILVTTHIDLLKQIIELTEKLVASEKGRVQQMMYNRCYLIGDYQRRKHKRHVAKSKKLKARIKELKEMLL